MPHPHKSMSCPVCDVALTMSERQGIEIDYCPQCRGVWLDRGELDKIIERSNQVAAQPAPPPQQPQPQYAPQPQPSYQPQPHYGKGYDPRYQKRRKSFLEELFD